VFARRRVRVRSCSHLLLCRLFYEADRRPRLAARPENRPRRDLVAPVCVFDPSIPAAGHHAIAGLPRGASTHGGLRASGP
jgi:hypothetical protein